MSAHQLGAIANFASDGVGGGVFAHPTQPRIIAVGTRGDIREVDVWSGATCASGSVGGRDAGGSALVRWRNRALVVVFGRSGTVGMWDVGAQTPHQTRVLKGDKLRGQDVACICGTQQADGPFGYIFAVRAKSSTIQTIRLQPLGIAHDKVAVDLASPNSTIITAMCCHPSRPWLVASLGQSLGVGDTHSRPDNEVLIWDYSWVAMSDKGRQVTTMHDDGGGDSGAADDELEEENLRGKLQLVATCRRGQAINTFPRLHITGLAISRGKHALLAAVGEDGLLLWSIVAVQQHCDAEAAAAAAAAAAASNALSSSRRGRARTIVEPSSVEVHAVARQAWGGANSPERGRGGYPARVVFDEQAQLLHLITRDPAHSHTSTTLNTLSLLPLHLHQIMPTNPLPLIASTEVNNKQVSDSGRGGLHSQRSGAMGAHLMVHPLCRRIVTVPLDARAMSIWRVVSHNFLGGVAGIAPVVARPTQTPPAAFLAYQPSPKSLPKAKTPRLGGANIASPYVPMLALKAPDSSRQSRRRRGNSSKGSGSTVAGSTAATTPPKGWQIRNRCDGECDDGDDVPTPVLEAAKKWQPTATAFYISFRGGSAVPRARDRSKVAALPPAFQYGYFSLSEVPLERDVDNKEASKHWTVAKLPCTERGLTDLLAACSQHAPPSSATAPAPGPSLKFLIPTRALSAHDGSAVIVLYSTLDHQHDLMQYRTRSLSPSSKDDSSMPLTDIVYRDIKAGRACTALQLLGRKSSKAMTTQLVLSENCVDAAWLEPSSDRPDRFVVLSRLGLAVQLFDRHGQVITDFPLYGAPGQPPGPPICRIWACSAALVEKGGAGMFLHAAFLPAANADAAVVVASTGQSATAVSANTSQSWDTDTSFAGIPGWSPQARGQLIGRQDNPTNVHRVQVLAYSNARDPNIDTQASKLLRLQVGESVYDIFEQPLDAPYNFPEGQAADRTTPLWDSPLLWGDYLPQNDATQYGGETCLPMLVIHTNYRILVVNSGLKILACRQSYRRPDRPTAGGAGYDPTPRAAGSGAIISTAWLGNCVICLHDDGAVDYLLPPRASASSGGLIYPLLCIAPSSLLGGGGGSILSLRPDRLFVIAKSARVKDPYSKPRLLTRILQPLEALVIGLEALICAAKRRTAMQVSSLDTSSRTLAQRRLSVRTGALLRLMRVAVRRHAPPIKIGDLSAAGEGPGMNAGASRIVFQTLRDLGLVRHALAVAGIGGTTHDRSGDQYPLRPWFSIRTRTAIATEARLWSVALLEIMADHPDLQRAVAMNDSNLALPLTYASISTRLRTLAWAAAAVGAHDSAKQAWDLAGDDVALVNLAVQLINSNSAGVSSGGRRAINECGKQLARDLNTALDAAAGSREDSDLVDGAIMRVVMRIISDEKRMDGDLLSAALIPACRLNRPARRFELLPTDETLKKIQRLSAEGMILSSPKLATRATIVKVLGVDRILKKMRLNRAEEWFGRARPECIVEECGVDWLDSTGQNCDSNEIDDSNQIGWEKGVGSNKKDEANLTGYWRFGEGSKAPPIDEGDVDRESLVCPSSFEDISGYKGMAQVIVEHPRAVLLTASTCSRLDEGEESSTHVAHDLVFTSPPPAAGSSRDGHSMRGLLIPVIRGGALDLGIFHEDPDRSNMTVEFWIKVPLHANGAEEAGDNDLEEKEARPLPFSTPQTLISRYICNSGHHVDLWILKLLPDGFLSVSLMASEGKQQSTSSVGIIAGKWCHVALVLSTRDSLTWTFKDPIETQQVDVLLYLDGKEVIQNNLPMHLPTTVLAEYFENNLSYIVVGENLGYHSRITELRFWACRRKVNDIQVSMENYLPQASKKRIKKFVIKKAVTAQMNVPLFALDAPPASQQLLKSPLVVRASGPGGFRAAAEEANPRRRRRTKIASGRDASNAALESAALVVSRAGVPKAAAPNLGINSREFVPVADVGRVKEEAKILSVPQESGSEEKEEATVWSYKDNTKVHTSDAGYAVSKVASEPVATSGKSLFPKVTASAAKIPAGSALTPAALAIATDSSQPMTKAGAGVTSVASVLMPCKGAPMTSNPAVVVYEKGGLKLTMLLIKTDLSNPSKFEIVLPKFIERSMKPPSAHLISREGGTLTQVLQVKNTLLGSKRLVFRLKIEYHDGTKHISETTIASNFPAGY